MNLGAMEMVDAHQHVWALSNPFHAWPAPGTNSGAIYRDYGVTEWAAEARPTGVTRSILVQAQEDWRETEWLIAQAESHPEVAGVVGWVDLVSPEAPEQIAFLSRHACLKGLRPMLQDMTDTAWLLSPALRPALRAMIRHGLRLDALIRPRHLEILCRFRREWRDLPVVIDHAAKPQIARPRTAGAGHAEWSDHMALLSELGVACKLSGLLTELPPGGDATWLDPYVRMLLALFPERLMWGSDWPVCLLAATPEGAMTYGKTLGHAQASVSALAPERAASVFARAAIAFYGLDQVRASP